MEDGQTQTASDRALIAVVAGDSDDRAAISTALSSRSGVRVVCSVSLENAADALTRQNIDALIGFVQEPNEWALFRALAERHPDALSVVLVSDPERIDAVSDGSVLNAVVQMTRDQLATHAAAAVNGLELPTTPIAAADAGERERLNALSEREREVLALTARGMAIKEIAKQLHRAYGTVAAHRVNIMEKLDLHDKVALTRFAIRNGLIDA